MSATIEGAVDTASRKSGVLYLAISIDDAQHVLLKPGHRVVVLSLTDHQAAQTKLAAAEAKLARVEALEKKAAIANVAKQKHADTEWGEGFVAGRFQLTGELTRALAGE